MTASTLRRVIAGVGRCCVRAPRVIAAVAAVSVTMPVAAQEPVDSAMNARIRDEGLHRARVMELFNHLTNVIGPRLTGSPAFKDAADWAVARLISYGLADVHLESWPFGRGWALEGFTLEMLTPRYFPLIGYPEAWTPSTAGVITGRPAYIGDLANEDSVRAHAAELQGAIVLATRPQDRFLGADRPQPTAHDQPVPIGAPPRVVADGPVRGAALASVLRDVHAAAVLQPTQGADGTLFVQGQRSAGDDAVPSVMVAADHYNLIVRALQSGAPVTLRVNVKSRYFSADTSGYNVIAEIPGSDPQVGDEVVLLGAHLDSWHAATGATDNADAVATLMEAMRILEVIGARPRRTIRMALWGGEEEGLLGSRAYAQQHYAGDANAGARAKFSVYLNQDPGTGPIYGWYLEGNRAVKPIFDAWLEPFRDLGARRNIIDKIGSTDHLSFVALGLPGFNSVQDYLDYDTREHHTNMDFFERVRGEDLREAAIVLASFAWHAAMRATKIPR
ncbi:MAG: M28 family peptidase [Gemmatimonadales bacterium]